MTKQQSTTTTVEPLLVRVEEAARILSLSRSTIYEMMDRGELASVRCGAARRIPLAVLRAWVDEQIGKSDVTS
jgi:excisionase family DNA binding protein